MKNIATRGLFAAAALLGGLSAAPSPANACSTPNSPIACANLPGSHPVSGLGTLFQNQFQPVPGVGPGFQDRGGVFQGDGRGDNSFYFTDDIWQLDDRWTFGTPSAAPGENAEPQSFSTDEARNTAQEGRVNAELNDIVRDYNSGSTGTDPEFDRQIILLSIELMTKDSAGLEIERQITSDLENAERNRAPQGDSESERLSAQETEALRQTEGGQGAGSSASGTSRARDPGGSPVLRSDTADVERAQGSMMDEIESFFVKM